MCLYQLLLFSGRLLSLCYWHFLRKRCRPHRVSCTVHIVAPVGKHAAYHRPCIQSGLFGFSFCAQMIQIVTDSLRIDVLHQLIAKEYFRRVQMLTVRRHSAALDRFAGRCDISLIRLRSLLVGHCAGTRLLFMGFFPALQSITVFVLCFREGRAIKDLILAIRHFSLTLTASVRTISLPFNCPHTLYASRSLPGGAKVSTVDTLPCQNLRNAQT